ncbi:mat-specific pheromone precursor encoded by the mfm protein [Triangularia setosa]|uniref:Mat-specific pheromone encoded by the mfm protein n=1 Tax=Triangularia setosa TaxID=2587417 RepID=A0AAN6WFQ5_9PEZI|nr:mat-specific pheromone precursor encoded by the mfm protein [Podospora setosa]
MKFSTPIALLAIAAVDAAVVQEDKRWCNTEGQACHTVARAAEAFTNAIKTSGVVARDESAAAQIARRQVDQLALAISASQTDPITFYTALGLGDQFTLEEKPHAEKRKAAPQWCLRFVGQSCWKRDASPEAAEEQKRCTSEDGACTKAKRAAEAVINAIEASGDNLAKREAAPQWCLRFVGQSCWKRNAAPEAACNAPDGACTKATRDIHAMYNAARHIIDASA